MTQQTKKNLLGRLFLRLRGRKPRDFANNTAILNETPKNHKPGKGKIVQK